MRNTAAGLLISLAITGCGQLKIPAVQPGDIVFQTSQSSQSMAIQLATRSPYSHMGLVLFRDGQHYVFEASQTVRFTPLDEWVARGDGGKCVVKRLKNAQTLLTTEKLTALEQAALKY
jgi:hypothetical protein